MNFESDTPSPQNSQDEREHPRRRESRDMGRLFFGLLILAFGATLFLDRLNLLDADHLFHYWPAIPVVVGLVKLASGRDGNDRFFGGVLVVVFGWILLDKLGLVEYGFDFSLIFPLILMIIGLRALTRPRRKKSLPSSTVDRADDLDAFAVLGALVRGSSSQSFRGGKATAVLAGAEIDLRQAKIEGNEARIDTFALWGGIEFIVPKEWEVVVNGTPILGGFDDQTRHPNSPDAPRLVITGFAIMGGVSARNENHRGA